MKIRIFAITISFLLVSFLFSSASAFGEDIKARMKARRPIIKELKAKGVVGEDAKGLLQFVGQKTRLHNSCCFHAEVMLVL